MTSIFLSYARADDEAFARRLHDDLTARGFDVWFDREDMPSRALTFLHEIREAIHERDRLVLVVGPAAVTSDYVEAEWREALELGKPVNPVLRLGDCPMSCASSTRARGVWFGRDDMPRCPLLFLYDIARVMPRHQAHSGRRWAILADTMATPVGACRSPRAGPR